MIPTFQLPQLMLSGAEMSIPPQDLSTFQIYEQSKCCYLKSQTFMVVCHTSVTEYLFPLPCSSQQM